MGENDFRRFKFDIQKGDIKTPEWFNCYWRPNQEAIEYWKWQYQLAKEGKQYVLPEETMRLPGQQLHQLMAKDYADKVMEKYNFNSLLDVGCNDGYMVKYFKDHDKKVIGINDFLYPTDFLYIEANQLELYEMDMHNIELPGDSFDAVWCRHVLEHSFAPLQVLSELYRVLKPGGLLFCILPPIPNPPEPYPGHWNQIPDYQLKYLLEMCNFDILEIENVYYTNGDIEGWEIRSISKKL